MSKILNFSYVVTFNKQIVLCFKRLSDHFQFNNIDNNNPNKQKVDHLRTQENHIMTWSKGPKEGQRLGKCKPQL